MTGVGIVAIGSESDGAAVVTSVGATCETSNDLGAALCIAAAKSSPSVGLDTAGEIGPVVGCSTGRVVGSWLSGIGATSGIAGGVAGSVVDVLTGVADVCGTGAPGPGPTVTPAALVSPPALAPPPPRLIDWISRAFFSPAASTIAAMIMLNGGGIPEFNTWT